MPLFDTPPSVYWGAWFFYFNVHRSRRIQPDERDDLERVARYIIRNPFSTEKMEFRPPNAVNKDGTVIYRSGMNPKIHRKKVWEADPLIYLDCQREMRIVSLIDESDVIEKILKCLGLWQQGVRVDPQRQSGADPPSVPWVYEPIDQDPFPDYDTEPADLSLRDEIRIFTRRYKCRNGSKVKGLA